LLNSGPHATEIAQKHRQTLGLLPPELTVNAPKEFMGMLAK
jgi:hypothetical protein